MKRSTLFTIIFIAILGVIGYIWYGYWQTPAADTSESAREDDFTRTLAQVARLKNLNLDTSFFRERAFTDLEEPQISPEPDITPGRPNPFAAFK
ncbi:MAG: hypothetical protein WAP52_01945 [Candidatus Sungiibacteriota bacterium]